MHACKCNNYKERENTPHTCTKNASLKCKIPSTNTRKQPQVHFHSMWIHTHLVCYSVSSDNTWASFMRTDVSQSIMEKSTQVCPYEFVYVMERMIENVQWRLTAGKHALLSSTTQLQQTVQSTQPRGLLILQWNSDSAFSLWNNSSEANIFYIYTWFKITAKLVI